MYSEDIVTGEEPFPSWLIMSTSEASSGTNHHSIVCAADHLHSGIHFTMARFITCDDSAKHWTLVGWAATSCVHGFCMLWSSVAGTLAACTQWDWIIACCPLIRYSLKGRLRKALFPLLQDLGGVHIYFLGIAFIIQRRSRVAAPEWIPEGRWVCCCYCLAAALLISFMTMFNSMKSAWVAFVHWEFSKVHCVAHFRCPQGGRLCLTRQSQLS